MHLHLDEADQKGLNSMSNTVNRRTILQTLAVGLALAARGESAQIPDEVVLKEKAKFSAHPFGDLRVYLDGNTEQLKGLSVGSLELKAGQSPHPPHTHPEEELLLVADGHCEISIGEKATKAGPGAVMYVGSNHVHGIVNTSKAPMTFYYIKWTPK
jgi:quercetin dioxygenase-like cupin family protein